MAVFVPPNPNGVAAVAPKAAPGVLNRLGAPNVAPTAPVFRPSPTGAGGEKDDRSD